MSLPQKVSKENFRLLDLSSDELSEDLHLEIVPSRKKKITRRERNRSTAPPVLNPNVATELRCALLWATRGTLLLWLVMLTWICASLSDQINNVSTSSKSVKDELQECHAAVKEFEANTSELSARLVKLELDHQELVKRVLSAQEQLSKITKQLEAAPELVNTPRQLKSLQDLVASMGSQIKGIEEEAKPFKTQLSVASTGIEEVKTLLHRLEEKSNETIANMSVGVKREGDIKQQIAALNATLAGKVEALEKRINELNKPTGTLVSSTSSPVSAVNNTSITTSTTSTTTQTPTQGSPSKPNVLHTEGTN